MSAATANGLAGDTAASRPLVLLCECAGTLANIDFDELAMFAGLKADVLRGVTWCSREGQARLLELMDSGAGGEAGDGRPLVFAGCSQDFANRRFNRLLQRGLAMSVADIREGCSWVHGDDVAGVTDKACRIVDAALSYPEAPADKLVRDKKVDSVLVIGGGVAGTQAAAELAQMGHHVELVERRSFLGGRAARIGTVFPTNDCGQCLPTTDAQAGTRKCFHRNVAIDNPNLHIWRRTTVESVAGEAGDFEVSLRRLPNVVTGDCVGCGICETVCEVANSDGNGKAIYAEFYDGRVQRTVDLETCTFCGACAEACPMDAIDFTQSPELTTVSAGAILTAVGCETAPPGAHRSPRLRPRRRRHPDGAGRAHGRLGRTVLARPATGSRDRHDPVRRLARPPPAALLLAAVLHDRPQARHPFARSVSRDEGDHLLSRAARRRRGLRELVPRGAARRG